MDIVGLILNGILVSVPEEFFLAFMALIFLGRYDFLDRYTIKTSIKKVFFIVVIPCVLISTFTLYNLQVSLYIRLLINTLILSIFMWVLLYISHVRTNIFEVFIKSAISMGILCGSEYVTAFILQYLFNFDISTLNSSPFINFTFVIPARLVMFFIVYVVYISQNSTTKINLVEMWKENRYFRIFVYSQIVVNTVFTYCIYISFVVNEYLAKLDSVVSFKVISIVLLLFLVEILFPWFVIYMMYPSEKLRKSWK